MLIKIKNSNWRYAILIYRYFFEIYSFFQLITLAGGLTWRARKISRISWRRRGRQWTGDTYSTHSSHPCSPLTSTALLLPTVKGWTYIQIVDRGYILHSLSHSPVYPPLYCCQLYRVDQHPDRPSSISASFPHSSRDSLNHPVSAQPRIVD